MYILRKTVLAALSDFQGVYSRLDLPSRAKQQALLECDRSLIGTSTKMLHGQ
jgi:hypothetical protein